VLLLLLLNPLTYSLGLTRAMREHIYTPLALVIFALLVWSSRVRDGALHIRTGIATALGLSLAAFWMTREEGLWLVPTLLAAVAMLVLVRLAGSGGALRARINQPSLRQDAGVTALALGVALCGVTAIGTQTMRAYGIADIVEFKQKEFLSAYGALSRVEPESWKPYVPVSRATLHKIYAVSPAAAALKPFLDGQNVQPTIQFGCQLYKVSPCDGEFRAAWFMWMLREGASAAGQYENARAARRYYRLLAREINAACADGRLTCGPPRAGMAPPFHARYVTDTRAALGLVGEYFTTLPDVVVSQEPRSCAVDDCPAAAPELLHFLSTLHSSLFVTYEDKSAHLPDRAPGVRRNAEMQRSQAITGALQAVTVFYRAYAWLLFVVGGASLVAAAIITLLRRRWDVLLTVAALAGAVAASRALLMAYMDAVAMPTISANYLSPAYPFLLLFAALGPVALFRAFTRSGP
jgi:hypothetical protein